MKFEILDSFSNKFAHNLLEEEVKSGRQLIGRICRKNFPKTCNQLGDIIKSALSLWDANSSRYTFSQVQQTQEGHVTVKLDAFYSGSIHSGIPAPEKAHWKWGSWEVLTKTCLSSLFSSPYCKNRRETEAAVHILSVKCQMHQDQAASFTGKTQETKFLVRTWKTYLLLVTLLDSLTPRINADWNSKRVV